MIVKCPYGYGEFKEDLQLLVCKPKGHVTNELMYDTVTCQGCHQQIDALKFNRFHDLREVTGIDLHFAAIVELAKKEREKRNGLPRVKACFLVSNQVVFGTLRIYETLAEDAGVEVHVSCPMAELAPVLGVEESELGV
jgi:hypothetical protein